MPRKDTECSDGPSFLFYTKHDSDISKVSISITEEALDKLSILTKYENIPRKYRFKV